MLHCLHTDLRTLLAASLILFCAGMLLHHHLVKAWVDCLGVASGWLYFLPPTFSRSFKRSTSELSAYNMPIKLLVNFKNCKREMFIRFVINNNGHGLEGQVVDLVYSYKRAKTKANGVLTGQWERPSPILLQKGSNKLLMTPWTCLHCLHQVSLSAPSHGFRSSHLMFQWPMGIFSCYRCIFSHCNLALWFDACVGQFIHWGLIFAISGRGIDCFPFPVFRKLYQIMPCTKARATTYWTEIKHYFGSSLTVIHS